jgi:endonuclease/exonuclease/phosphatase family metal-dependent hydrolase
MEVRLITCNIRFDNPADGENRWEYRRELLARTLLQKSPDIIATQEGRYHQLVDLASLLPGYRLVDDHRAWIKERMYPSFFVKENRFEVFPGLDLWLSETPDIAESRSFDSAFPRLLTWLRLQPIGSEKNFLVVNTHLDHVKRETRIKQTEVLSSEMKKRWNPHWPIIITGDFNDEPEGDVRQLLVDAFPGLTDAWKLFHQHEETSHHPFTGELETGSRIDWILLDARLKAMECVLDKFNESGRYPTDHFPVYCRFSL